MGLLDWAFLLLQAQAPPFSVPAGHAVERVAGPPLVERPIMASFDDRGRLYVADSAGVNHDGNTLAKNPPHCIRILEDADGDGTFDASKIFADKLVFPQGLLWHDGAVYCVSPPELWKLEDTDGDDVADRRTPLVMGMALTGVADDAHGCILGPDGRLYFLPGRMHHRLRLADGTPFKDAVGPWIMRCRPDGRDVEIVSGAQGNPVEIDFTPEGDFFCSGTFWAPDSFGGGLRDALVHGVEGGEYPVRDRVYKDRKRTGDLLPVLVPMAATAPAGMMIARGDGRQDTIYCTCFNTHRVQRHRLTRVGATFRAATEDFAVGTHADVHPTDVLEDADGSILVLDTGGWFRIGCPTSQVAKPQVLGGIYRVRIPGVPRLHDPRGLRLGNALAPEHLDDPRWVVRERAVRELSKLADSVPALRRVVLAGDSLRQRLNALWTLGRIDTPESTAAIRRALEDRPEGIRQVAATLAGLRRDPEAAPLLCRLLGDRDESAAVRREAAGALGRIGRAGTAPVLLEALRGGPDRFLEHAILFALIRIDAPEAARPGLADADPAVRRGALIALDQMDHGDLAASEVLAFLGDAALRREAADILARRRGWSDAIAEACSIEGGETSPLLLEVLRAHIHNEKIQSTIARALHDRGPQPAWLELIASSGLKEAPEAWKQPLSAAIAAPDPAATRAAIRAVEALRVAGLEADLGRLAADPARPAELRLLALRARGGALAAPEFALAVEEAGSDTPTPESLLAVLLLGASDLTTDQLGEVAALARHAGPIELPTLLNAFEKSDGDAVGRALAQALAASPGVWAVPIARLEKLAARIPELGPVLERVRAESKQDPARLDALQASLVEGDAEAGRALFTGKATCHVCHTVAGRGGVVGPDLSTIGAIREPRDLLEAIVFPSASFARGFEPVMVAMKDGSTRVGRAGREGPDVLEIVDAQGRTHAIKRAEIFAVTPNRVSVMPEGLDRTLSPRELSDLIAYLRSRR